MTLGMNDKAIAAELSIRCALGAARPALMKALRAHRFQAGFLLGRSAGE